MRKNVMNNLKKLRTFPCWKCQKYPVTKRGYKDAVVNFEIEKAISLKYNIGLALAPSNLIAIDMDVDPSRGKDGIETIKQLELRLGKLPRTLAQKTPHGGLHLIFSARGINPQTVIGKIKHDVDVKYNGYILVEDVEDKAINTLNSII